MKHFFIISFITSLTLSCSTVKEEKNINPTSKKDSVIEGYSSATILSTEDQIIPNSSLTDSIIENLPTPFSIYQLDQLLELNIDSFIKTRDPYNNLFERADNELFYNQFTTDTSQFDKAHYLKMIGVIQQHKDFYSALFTDTYDYKKALHLINIDNKTSLPISSHILFSNGGDAEDFWQTRFEIVDSLTFISHDLAGYKHNMNHRDSCTVNFKNTYQINYNNETGKRTKILIGKMSDFKSIINWKN